MSEQGDQSGGVGFSAPSPAELDEWIGDAYEVTQMIGCGGMGAVYRAKQPRLDRWVAIKLLPSIEDDDGVDYIRRFEIEAKAMAKLDHPNILTVFDFGEIEPQETGQKPLLYFVMEFVDGTDLSELIPSGELGVEHVTSWLPQVCDALQYAHGRGIIHRDIKPANIMVTREGKVKVADFGLATITVNQGESANRSKQSNVTFGTPDYVAPEALIIGVEVDHRADIFALGVLLYEMLTGRVPGEGKEPASTLVPELDPRFDSVATRAMHSDREQRFQNAGDVGAALARIREEPAVRRRTLITGPVNPTKAAPKGATASVQVKAAAGGDEVQKRLAEQKAKREAEAKAAEEKAQRKKLVLSIAGGTVGAALVGVLIVLKLMGGGADDTPKTPVASQGPSKIEGVSLASAETQPSKPKPKPGPTSKPAPKPSPKPSQETSSASPRSASADSGGSNEESSSPSEVSGETSPTMAGGPRGDEGPTGSGVSEPQTQTAPPGESGEETEAPVASVDTPEALAAVKMALASLEKEFQSGNQATAQSQYETELAALNQKYLGALQRDAQSVRNNASVMNHYRAEAARIQAGEGVPETDPEPFPPRLKVLRDTWRAEQRRMAAVRGRVLEPELRRYHDEIESLADELVAEGKVRATEPIREVRLRLESQIEAIEEVMALADAGTGEIDPQESEGNRGPIAVTKPVLTAVREHPFPLPRSQVVGEVITWNAKSPGQITVVADEVVDFSGNDAGGFVVMDPGGKLRRIGTGTYPSLKNIRPLEDVIDLAICREYGMALTGSGEFEVWGLPPDDVKAVPRTLKEVVKFAVRPNHALALKPNGRLEVWGSLGPGLRDFMVGESNVVDFVVAGEYAVILKKNGRIMAFDGGSPTLTPEDLEKANGIRNAVAVDCQKWASGSCASIALLQDGRVVTWGWPRLADGSEIPVPADLPRDIDQVRMGQQGKAAVHSVSQGWLIFGKDINREMNQALTKGCADLHFLGSDRVVGFRTEKPEVPEANSGEMLTGTEKASGRTIRVSPAGEGDTVTLHEALATAQEGDRLWLAPGDYLPSPEILRDDQKPAHVVETSGLMIVGHRSRLKGPLILRAKSGPVLRGVWPDAINIGRKTAVDSADVPSRNLLIENCRAHGFSASPGCQFHVRNFLGTLHTSDRCEATIEGATVVSSNTRYMLHRARTVIRDSIFSTGAEVVFKSYDETTQERQLENVILHSGSDVLDVENGVRVKSIGELGRVNIKAENCQFADPLFVDPANQDWRVKEGSPAAGKGATLDEEGWPISVSE